MSYLNLSGRERRAKFARLNRIWDERLDHAMDGTGQLWSFEDGLKMANRSRNRYTDVLPWDQTRVRLHAGGGNSDYINASHVTLGTDHHYIASQGPLDATISHFWAMCFSESEKGKSPVIVVVMVTPLVEKGREKCAPYWPTKGSWDLSKSAAQVLLAKNMELSFKQQNHNGSFQETNMVLTVDGVSKEVYHFLYDNWQDTLVPDSVDPLITLSRKLSEFRAREKNVVPVVHCSAGIGRTGTFLAIDYFLNTEILKEDSDPVYDTVMTMREQRMMMVQTPLQYLLLYDVANKIKDGGFDE